jgi:hypothetical protein
VELSYPVFSRGTYMRTGKDRVEMAAIEEPVSIGGHLVRPGDLVVGDSDGVAVIPAEREQQVLHRAWTIHRTEQRIRDAIAAGMSLREARAKYGYHSPQTLHTAGRTGTARKATGRFPAHDRPQRGLEPVRHRGITLTDHAYYSNEKISYGRCLDHA